MKGIVITSDGYACIGRDLGGPGSGNFGHSGIPGQRGGSVAGTGGGSEIRDGVARGFAAKTDNLQVEHGIIIGADNKAITIKGDNKSIQIPKGTDVKDSHFIHNHPAEKYPGLSPADVETAITRDMASMTATGRAGIIGIDRPEGGWGNITSEDVKAAYRSEFKAVRERFAGKGASDEELSKALSESSKKAIGNLGLTVRYEER